MITMPYEYRKLSPKQREEIIQYRHQHGYPLHAPPHPFREAGAYLISAANFEHLRLAFNYIHYNPVKHGYVSDPFEWPWSSLLMYYEDKGKDWLQEQRESYQPPDDFGKVWDDNVKND